MKLTARSHVKRRPPPQPVKSLVQKNCRITQLLFDPLIRCQNGRILPDSTPGHAILVEVLPQTKLISLAYMAITNGSLPQLIKLGHLN